VVHTRRTRRLGSSWNEHCQRSSLTFWMQTTGATLLTVRQCSLACMWMLAQGSRSAYGLLYFTAVRATGASETSERFRTHDVQDHNRGHALTGGLVEAVWAGHGASCGYDHRVSAHLRACGRSHPAPRIGHLVLGVGLLVPKPSTGAGYQRCGMSDLGSTVRRCPLASTAVGGDCYSLGYSVARESVS
jgi:hypothetical protein